MPALFQKQHYRNILLLKLTKQTDSQRSCSSGGIKVSICKTFAQFLRNETQNFSFFAHQFSRKNNNLRNHSQKSFRAKLPYSAFAKLKFCAILQLEFCAIPQFRKNQTVGDGVCFLQFNSSSAGRFCTKIRNRLSSKVSTILVLDMHISYKWILQALVTFLHYFMQIV